LEELNRFKIRIIKFNTIGKRNKPFQILSFLIKHLSKEKYDVIIAFMFAPSALCSVANFFSTNSSAKLIVSERSFYKDEKNWFKSLLFRATYFGANRIVCNSFTQKDWLCKFFPFYKNKICVIYNGIIPREIKITENNSKLTKTLLGVGRISREKNIETILYALIHFYENYGWLPKFKWAGSLNQSADKVYLKKLNEIIEASPCLKNNWEWLGQRNDVEDLMKNTDALVLASHYEGFANVVCESLNNAKPVFISDVCDHGRIIKHGENGYLFEKNSSIQLSNLFFTFYECKQSNYIGLRKSAYETYLQFFTFDNMVNRYTQEIQK
jgi:glycosyltransferase involved in cell wall biosynthesis